jgi:GNAT superfamily N-acetyltransferase
MEVSFKRLSEDAVARVAAFECEIAQISFPDDPVTDIEFYGRKLRQAMADAEQEPLVGWAGGKLACWAWIAPRKNFITGERYGDLRSFYVAKGYRGAGVAFALMRHCMEFCETHDLTRLVGRTSATNESMKAVYSLYGFEPKHIVFERRIETSAPAKTRGRTR